MIGGTRSYEIARRLAKRGHEVHIITADTSNQRVSTDGPWVREIVEGIYVHWLSVPYDNAMSYKRRLWAFGVFAVSAGRYAAGLGGDVVFATSTPLTIAIPGVFVKRKLRVPMVFEVRDLWPELPIAMGALNWPFSRRAAHWLERWAYRNSERVIGLSPGMCEGVIKTGYPSESVVCVPNSCDLELFQVADSEGKRFRSERPWLGDRHLVVYAGTLGRINGVGYLVRLAAAVRKLDPGIRFLVVGEGAEFDEIRALAIELGVFGENFFMEPAVPKSDVPALLNAATICTSLFLPIRPMWNNSANKFFDALASGTPVMINYGGWQASLLEESGAGITVPHDDLEAAATRLVDYLSDNSRLAAAGESASMLARDKFSRDHLAEKLESTLLSAVDSYNA
jgi:glycosyltransferase involved in cell wall biosynthesis